MDMMVVVNTMVELFLLLILGYGLAKKGMIDSKTNGKLSGLVVHVSFSRLCSRTWTREVFRRCFISFWPAWVSTQ